MGWGGCVCVRARARGVCGACCGGRGTGVCGCVRVSRARVSRSTPSRVPRPARRLRPLPDRVPPGPAAAGRLRAACVGRVRPCPGRRASAPAAFGRGRGAPSTSPRGPGGTGPSSRQRSPLERVPPATRPLAGGRALEAWAASRPAPAGGPAAHAAGAGPGGPPSLPRPRQAAAAFPGTALTGKRGERVSRPRAGRLAGRASYVAGNAGCNREGGGDLQLFFASPSLRARHPGRGWPEARPPPPPAPRAGAPACPCPYCTRPPHTPPPPPPAPPPRTPHPTPRHRRNPPAHSPACPPRHVAHG